MRLVDLDPRLLRVTYASRAADGLTRADLRDIAAAAHRNNPRTGLTGLLLYVEGDFLQILEGPADAVETMFETIEADPRNRFVTRLSSERALRRAFADWTMGCFELGLAEIEDGPFFILDADAPRVRPRLTGDFSVFLEQFYARNRHRHRAGAFAPAV